jgi:hypothetical protein
VKTITEPLRPFIFNFDKLYIRQVMPHAEYDRALARLDELLDLVGTNARHPLYSLLDTMGTLVYANETQRQQLAEGNGIGAPDGGERSYPK